MSHWLFIITKLLSGLLLNDLLCVLVCYEDVTPETYLKSLNLLKNKMRKSCVCVSVCVYVSVNVVHKFSSPITQHDTVVIEFCTCFMQEMSECMNDP